MNGLIQRFSKTDRRTNKQGRLLRTSFGKHGFKNNDKFSKVCDRIVERRNTMPQYLIDLSFNAMTKFS